MTAWMLLATGVGAAVGAPLRYLAGRAWDDLLPWGTIGVNVAGSFLLGLVSALALGGAAPALLGVGFCGGLTTFSTFAVQIHDAGWRRGALTIALTVVPAVAACALGFTLAP